MSRARRGGRRRLRQAEQIRGGYAGEGVTGASATGPLEFQPIDAIARGEGAVHPLAVIGGDDRRLVEEASTYPWRAICRLDIAASDGARLSGTGWMASPRLLVTAGHCLFDRDRGGWASEVEIHTGLPGAGVVTARRFLGTRGWVRDGERSYDYGGIILPLVEGQAAVGDQTGFFGVKSASSASLSSSKVNLAGFPITPPDDQRFGTLWWHSQAIHDPRRRLLLYSIDTDEGQSGAPLWIRSGSSRQVVGIHVSARSGVNAGVRVTNEVISTLRDWILRAS
jgi:glutamyl endopeptidase